MVFYQNAVTGELICALIRMGQRQQGKMLTHLLFGQRQIRFRRKFILFMTETDIPAQYQCGAQKNQRRGKERFIPGQAAARCGMDHGSHSSVIFGSGVFCAAHRSRI